MIARFVYYNNLTMHSQLVFGAGLIGCYLGGVLTHIAQRRENSGNVSLYCRPSMADKISSGLTLTDYVHNTLSVENVSIIRSDEEVSPHSVFDIVWLTVKCTGLQQAVEDMKPFVGQHTLILCCQNGLDSDHTVREAFPDNEIIRVMVPFNVVDQENGHFHRGSEGRLTIESSTHDAMLRDCLCLDGSDDGSVESRLPLDFTADMTAMQWAKLQLNLGNSINALANIPVKAMLEQREYRLVIAAMMTELLSVAKALNLTLPKVASVSAPIIPWILRLPNWLFKRVANKMLAIDPTVRTSMWWDINAGRKTEIEFLNGAVLRNAERLGIDCPVNAKVVDMIHEAEASNNGKDSISACDLYHMVGLK
ncbi:2-dehydropantoate 2-reductase [Alteromonas facilis]|uniref:2-dehydropantoate 2-reductase n=1 Tax=Alteromonas facilis TaxID=2048004 RepID=UPI000C285014|nr:2-dehydropantoate 2-reductase [Alteromonas facilis]